MTEPPATRTPGADPTRHDPSHYLTLARRHYENFPVGSWLLPKHARRHLHRIYAFARTADDLADELRDAAALAAFRADFLKHLDGGRSDVPMFAELVQTIRELRLLHRTAAAEPPAGPAQRPARTRPHLLPAGGSRTLPGRREPAAGRTRRFGRAGPGAALGEVAGR